MSNYADYLTHFNYTPVYRNTKDYANADYFSRAIPPEQLKLVQEREEDDDFEQFAMHLIHELPITSNEIATETRKDSELGPIHNAIAAGSDLKRLGYIGN